MDLREEKKRCFTSRGNKAVCKILEVEPLDGIIVDREHRRKRL